MKKIKNKKEALQLAIRKIKLILDIFRMKGILPMLFWEQTTTNKIIIKNA